MDPHRRSAELQAYGLLVVTTFFWSLNYVLVRWYRDDAPPVTMAFWRWALALAMFVPFAWRAVRDEWSKIKTHRWQLLALGACSCSLNSVLAYIGIQSTALANASLLNSMTPILTILLAVPLSHERLTPGRLLGVLTSFAGVVCIVVRGDIRTITTLELAVGDLAIIAACAVWGVYTNLLRRWSAHLSQVASLATMMATGVLVMTPIYAVEIAVTQPVRWSAGLVVALLVLALFPSLLANLFWNRAVLTVGPGRSAAISYLLPVFTIAMAVGVMGESLHWYHWVGAVFIFAGIAIVHRAR
jgi:drug/metabolite transporter (DMT)-like permease